MSPASTASTTDQRNRRALVVRSLCELTRFVIGGREIGNNGGQLVNRWQRVTGNGSGDAWCASFAVAAVVAVLRALFQGRVTFPLPLSGSCDVLLARARKLGIAHELRPGEEPQPGDLVLCLASDTDAVHVMVADDTPIAGPQWASVEGNTDSDGDREGDSVQGRTRGGPADRNRYMAVRWLDVLTLPPLFNV